MKKKTIKWIFGIIGVIFLGAVGSGLWQIGIEPVGSRLLEIIFKITTLGISSFSDNFYKDVAKGFHEEVSILITSILLLLLSYRILYLYQSMNNIKIEEILSHIKILSKWFYREVIFCFIVLIAVLYFRAFSLVYKNILVKDFDQKFMIAKLVMNEEEEEKMLAKFAMIKNKQDYVYLIDTLQEMVNKKVEDLNSSSVKDKTK